MHDSEEYINDIEGQSQEMVIGTLQRPDHACSMFHEPDELHGLLQILSKHVHVRKKKHFNHLKLRFWTD